MARPAHPLPLSSFPQPAGDARESGNRESLGEIIVRLVQRPSIATDGPGETVPTGLLVWQHLKRNGWNRR